MAGPKNNNIVLYIDHVQFLDQAVSFAQQILKFAPDRKFKIYVYGDVADKYKNLAQIDVVQFLPIREEDAPEYLKKAPQLINLFEVIFKAMGAIWRAGPLYGPMALCLFLYYYLVYTAFWANVKIGKFIFQSLGNIGQFLLKSAKFIFEIIVVLVKSIAAIFSFIVRFILRAINFIKVSIVYLFLGIINSPRITFEFLVRISGAAKRSIFGAFGLSINLFFATLRLCHEIIKGALDLLPDVFVDNRHFVSKTRNFLQKDLTLLREKSSKIGLGRRIRSIARIAILQPVLFLNGIVKWTAKLLFGAVFQLIRFIIVGFLYAIKGVIGFAKFIIFNLPQFVISFFKVTWNSLVFGIVWLINSIIKGIYLNFEFLLFILPAPFIIISLVLSNSQKALEYLERSAPSAWFKFKVQSLYFSRSVRAFIALLPLYLKHSFAKTIRIAILILYAPFKALNSLAHQGEKRIAALKDRLANERHDEFSIVTLANFFFVPLTILYLPFKLIYKVWTLLVPKLRTIIKKIEAMHYPSLISRRDRAPNPLFLFFQSILSLLQKILIAPIFAVFLFFLQLISTIAKFILAILFRFFSGISLFISIVSTIIHSIVSVDYFARISKYTNKAYRKNFPKKTKRKRKSFIEAQVLGAQKVKNQMMDSQSAVAGMIALINDTNAMKLWAKKQLSIISKKLPKVKFRAGPKLRINIDVTPAKKMVKKRISNFQRGINFLRDLFITGPVGFFQSVIKGIVKTRIRWRSRYWTFPQLYEFMIESIVNLFTSLGVHFTTFSDKVKLRVIEILARLDLEYKFRRIATLFNIYVETPAILVATIFGPEFLPKFYGWRNTQIANMQKRINEIPVLNYSLFIQMHLRAYKRIVEIDNPSAVILLENNCETTTTILSNYLEKVRIPSYILPTTIPNPQEPAQYYFNDESRQANNLIGRIIRKAFSQWGYLHNGRQLIRMCPQKIVTSEFMGLKAEKPWMLNYGPAAKIFVESEAMGDIYKALGFNESQLANVGDVADIAMANSLKSKVKTRAKIYKELGLKAGKPLLLCAFPPNQYGADISNFEFETFEDLLKAWFDILEKAAKHFNVIIRPHPRLNLNDYKIKLKANIKISNAPTNELVPLADLYLASISATIRWTLACGIPVINYDTYRYNYDDYNNAEACVTIFDAKSAMKATEDFVKGDNSQNSLALKAQNQKLYWGNIDADFGERVVKVLDANL